MTSEEGPPPSPVTSPAITPRAPSSTTLGHATTPKKGTGGALHLEIRSVGTAGDQYELQTIIIPTVHAPMTVRMES